MHSEKTEEHFSLCYQEEEPVNPWATSLDQKPLFLAWTQPKRYSTPLSRPYHAPFTLPAQPPRGSFSVALAPPFCNPAQYRVFSL